MDSKDRLYVCDLGNDRVQRFTFDKDGKAVFDAKWGESGNEPEQFDHPYAVCVDKQDNFYVADFGNHRVQCFNPDGRLQYVCGKRGSEEGDFEMPVGLAVDGNGALYVADLGNNRVQKLAPAG
jgi:DNA-binding beta-propeller fold protein YncE